MTDSLAENQADIAQLRELLSEIRWRIQDGQLPEEVKLGLAEDLSRVGVEVNKMIGEVLLSADRNG